MKKYYNLLILIAFSTLVIAQQEVHLRIDPHGHMSQIRDLEISNDHQHIITSGYDKMAIKWNLNTGDIDDVYRGYIDVGSEGMMYYTALSPDNKLYAMAGWFGADDETESLGDVRVFDYKSGKLLTVLKGLEGTPVGMGFSNDSKYLICGDGNSKILKWEVLTGNQVDQFVYHPVDYEEALHRLVIKNDRMLSIDWRGHLCLWDINDAKKPLRIESKFIKEALGNDIGPIAISPNLDEYIVCLNHIVIIFDEKLKFVEYFEKDLNPGFVEYNADGSRFITGAVGKGVGEKPCVIYEKVNGSYKEIARYNGHLNTVLAGGFVSNDTLVTAGGDDDEVHIWKINKDNTTTLVSELKGLGDTYYASALENESVGFTKTWTENFGKSTLTEEFDMLLKEFRPIANDNYRKPISNNGDLSLSTYNSGGYTLTNEALVVQKSGKANDTIFREYWNGSRHNSFTISDNGYIISGGSYGILEAFNPEGVVTNRFVAHEGEIWSSNISNDGKKLITCGTDKTIRIWSLEKLGIVNPNPPEKSVREVMDELQVPLDETVYQKVFKMLKIYDIADDKTYESWEKIITELRNGDWPCDFLQNRLDYYKSTEIYPIVSLFFTDDNEWIIWNPDGYFTSSKEGAKYVGYHVNKGKDKEAKFYPFEQFDLKYNRPDIILKDLELGNERIIDFFYKSYLKRLKNNGLKEEDLQNEIQAPNIEVISHSVDGNLAQITLKAFDEKYRLQKIQIAINGVPVFGKGGVYANFNKDHIQSLEVELAKGSNKIELSVYNNKGVESLKEYIYIKNGELNEKPNLYLLSIGTSAFQQSDFNLKYAAKDAQDVINTFLEDDKYQNVYTRVLLDENVTQEKILEMKGFLRGAGRDDVVMVFVAGHGLLDENYNYYYATHNIDFNKPSLEGVAYEEIESLLEGLSALRKLLIMDTCHSGEIDAEDVEVAVIDKTEEGDVMFRSVGTAIAMKESDGFSTTEMVKELFVDLRKGTGATVISSAGGAEFAMESDQWKNGLFTYCLLNGLQSKSADQNQDGAINISELKTYVQEEVFTLSKGRQSPASRIENLNLDFEIW